MTALAGANLGKIIHKLDRLEPLYHLMAVLDLNPETEWGTVRHGQRFVVHFVGQDCLFMQGGARCHRGHAGQKAAIERDPFA